MQTAEDKELPTATPDPQSQPLDSIPPGEAEDEDDIEVIFAKAVAEIDTQPLIKKKRAPVFLSIGDLLELSFDVSLLLCMLCGSIYIALTYPHTLVILYAKAAPAAITTALDVPTRTLAPVTITRSATIATTGTGHQDARAATGQLTFYNGLFTTQEVPAGTLFIGRDGMKVISREAAMIPASDPSTTPPQEGYVTVTAQAQQAGAAGNIAAYDINATVTNGISVKNTSRFHNGQDARTFKAVAKADVDTLTSTVSDTLTQAFATAFPLQKGEEVQPTNCHLTASADHQVGEEAQGVTLAMSKTCSAVAYNQSQLTRAAAAAFTRTRPAASYHLVGSLRTTLHSMAPLTVTLNGKWVYTFTPDYEEFLAQRIQEESPAQARAFLVSTGVISYASIPAQLPPAMYINFFVMVD